MPDTRQVLYREKLMAVSRRSMFERRKAAPVPRVQEDCALGVTWGLASRAWHSQPSAISARGLVPRFTATAAATCQLEQAPSSNGQRHAQHQRPRRCDPVGGLRGAMQDPWSMSSPHDVDAPGGECAEAEVLAAGGQYQQEHATRPGGQWISGRLRYARDAFQVADVSVGSRHEGEAD